MKQYKSDRVFNTVNATLLTLYTLVVIFPFWYVLSSSLTDYSYFAQKGGLILYPSHISFRYYTYLLFGNNIILSTYLNTIIYTFIGTAIALVLTVITAYALSDRTLPGRRVLSLYFIFTMFFNGGMVPTYVTMKIYHLVGTREGLILIMCFTVFNTILMRTFFEGIPLSLKESAKIDGASDVRVMLQIVMPLSAPAITTVGLFYAVGYWNDFINSMLYASPIKITTIQKVLLDIINGAGLPNEIMTTGNILMEMPPQVGIRFASIIIVGLPMMLFYPFVQKYFEKGITIGAEKG